MKVYLLRPGKAARLCLLAVTLIVVCAPAANGQETQLDSFDSIKPTPVITGSTAYFSRVNGGQWQDSPSISPLLLFPIGNKLLLEAKGASTETWAKNAQGDYAGTFTYGMAYAQLDFVASRYMTVTAGKFVTPFNIYSERLTPNWIRALQTSPLTSPVTSNGSLGGMVRGGFPVNGQSVNLTYAAYFSANNTNHITATDRSSGGRLGFFLPGPRLEFGGSYQQVLQADRPHSAGAYVEWQPNPLPLTLRSEYVRSSGTKGSGYWIESVYRLSQIPYLKRLELAGRGQQFFAAPNLPAATIKKLGALGRDTNEGDAGLNYYFRSDVRASATYGRQFALGHDANLWVFGMTWRFVSPLLPSGGAQ